MYSTNPTGCPRSCIKNEFPASPRGAAAASEMATGRNTNALAHTLGSSVGIAARNELLDLGVVKHRPR